MKAKAILAVISSLMCVHAVLIAFRQWDATNWRPVQALVVEWGDGDSEDNPEWSGSWYANPRIAYAYEVNGLRYRGTRVGFSPFNYQRRSAFERELGMVRDGRTISVWYDPRQPSDAVVVNSGVGISTGLYLLVSAGLALILWRETAKTARTIGSSVFLTRGTPLAGQESRQGSESAEP